MAGLALPPGFGGRRWGEVDWARFNRLTNPPFSVGSSADWAPSINTGANRTINIAPGVGQAHGTMDVTDATETISFAANGGGTDRYDAVVARFDWTTKTRVFAVIPGTTVAPAVNTTTSLDVNKINRISGARYDGLIALVKIPPGRTILQPGDLYSDMRVWGGATGPMVSNTISSQRSLLDIPIGGQITVNGLDTYVRQPNGSLMTLRPRLLAVGTGTQSVAFNSEISIPLSNEVTSAGVSYNPANGRCTFLETGDYFCSVTVTYVATPNYRGRRSASLGRNGTELLYTRDSVFPNDADEHYMSTSALLHFDAGQYVTAMTSHVAEVVDTGANVSATIDRAKCQLSVMYAGG